MLTQEKIEQIKKDAEEKYPVIMMHFDGKNNSSGMYGFCDCNYYIREAYISGATHEAEEGEKMAVEFALTIIPAKEYGQGESVDNHDYIKIKEAITTYNNSLK